MTTFFTDRNLGKRFGRRLRKLGLLVEIHDDHLDQETCDEDLLRYAAANGWVIVTADYRIRYRPAEKEAIITARAAVIHVKQPPTGRIDELAEHFAANATKVEHFLQKHQPPLFAVYRIDSDGKARLRLRNLSAD